MNTGMDMGFAEKPTLTLNMGEFKMPNSAEAIEMTPQDPRTLYPKNPEDYVPWVVEQLEEARLLRKGNHEGAWNMVVEVLAIGHSLTVSE